MNEAVDTSHLRTANIWARHPQDFYIEPRWTSERLFAVEKFTGDIIDPSCGTGRICWSAAAAGYNVVGTDIVKRWPDSDEWPIPRPEPAGLTPTLIEGQDFLSPGWGRLLGSECWWREPSNIVSNPPFGMAEQIIRLALKRASRKVAMLLPSKWTHGDKRARWLETTPLRKVLFITPRPSMPPGPVIEAGINPGGGKEDFAWFIWLQGYDGKPELGWLRRDAA